MAGDILTLISSVEILTATGIVYSYYAFHEAVNRNMTVNRNMAVNRNMTVNRNMDENKHVDYNNKIAGIEAESAKNSEDNHLQLYKQEWYQLGLPIVTNNKLRSLKGQACRKFFNRILINKHNNSSILAAHIDAQ